MKKIVFKNLDGSVGIITASPKWQGTLEELAKKDVPEGLEWRIVDVSQLPLSRNWRDAWTDENHTKTVDVDLEKAKKSHKEVIIKKAQERVKGDEFGQKDFSQVKDEIDAIDFDSIKSLEELYNTFPASIDKRDGKRKYVSHDK